jgi:hypothetical protein
LECGCAATINTPPHAKRMSSRPIPSQPRRNFEILERKDAASVQSKKIPPDNKASKEDVLGSFWVSVQLQ